MATVTVTETQQKRRLPKNVKLPPENERYMRACADIASALIQDYEAQANGTKAKKDLNLNQLRGQIAKKHYLKSQPPLTAIIAAVPEHYKKYILPKLIAKPIRTLPNTETCCQMGVDTDMYLRYVFGYCCGSGNVQATSLSPYRLHRQYLRLLPRRTRLRL
jgi:elongator complex protein 3